MKKNRRSQRNKMEKFRDKAVYLLENFNWDTEERLLLEIMAQGLMSIGDIREANWTEVSEGLGSIIIKGIEFKLSEESLADFSEALTNHKDFSGEEIDPRDTLHKIFTHKTGKEISKVLLQSE